jgi:hypothetical protein
MRVFAPSFFINKSIKNLQEKMSRLTGTDTYGLMAAYNAVYAPQELTEEQVWEEVETWVNSLLEEGYDLSEYTWEEMYEAYIKEQGGIYGTTNANYKPNKLDTAIGNVVKSITSSGADSTPRTTGIYGQPTRKPTSPTATRPATPSPTATRPSAPAPSASRPSGGAPRPTAPGSGKVSPTKPAPSAQTGDKTKDMATFAKANPKLAAAAAERSRTRGTSSTTNPLMKDMKSRLPAATPKVAPSNTLSNTVAAASKPAAFSPAPEVKATNKIAAAPKPITLTPRQQRLNMEMEYDAYDVVLEYLLSQGHVDTVEEAHYVMMVMDTETIGTIVEESRDPRGRVSSGPMNVYANPKKPSKEHSDAVKAYDEKQKKKTPEQRKKELDDYIQRQRENK